MAFGLFLKKKKNTPVHFSLYRTITGFYNMQIMGEAL